MNITRVPFFKQGKNINVSSPNSLKQIKLKTLKRKQMVLKS